MNKRNLPKTEEHKQKIRLAQLWKIRPQTTWEKNWNWKWEQSKYTAHHMWVIFHKWKPNYCEHCKKTDLRPRQYQWANIDHKYKRNLDDYIRLCATCHKKFDIDNNGYTGRKSNILITFNWITDNLIWWSIALWINTNILKSRYYRNYPNIEKIIY